MSFFYYLRLKSFCMSRLNQWFELRGKPLPQFPRQAAENLPVGIKFLLCLILIGNVLAVRSQGIVRDRDGNMYKTLRIKNQTWMAENLIVSHYRNGEAIPEAKSSADWERFNENRTGCWCYYEFNTLNGRKYGKLYNWFAVNDPRGLAPKGWHIPKDVEWLVFTDYTGSEIRPGKRMKTTSGWGEDNYCNGNNVTEFSGLPGGTRTVGVFSGIGLIGSWWCSTESEINFARIRSLASNSDDLWLNVALKQCGNSVRCVMD